MICLSFIFYPFHWSFYLIITLLCLRMSFLFSVYYLLMQSYFLVTVSYQPFWEYQLEFFFFKFFLFPSHFCLFQDCLFHVCVSICLLRAPGFFSWEVMLGSLFVSGMKGWRPAFQDAVWCADGWVQASPTVASPSQGSLTGSFLLGRVGDPTNTRVCPTRRTPQRVLGVLLALLSLFIDIHFNCLWRREKAKANTHGLSLTSWTNTGFRRFGV